MLGNIQNIFYRGGIPVDHRDYMGGKEQELAGHVLGAAGGSSKAGNVLPVAFQ